MAIKKNNPGCPCCGFPCEATECNDDTTLNIRRVTLSLSMPDEIVLINPLDAFGARFTYVSDGWSSINGTYTFELNLKTCTWLATAFPDSSGVSAQAWRLGSNTDCSNYLDQIADAEGVDIPAFPYQSYGEGDIVVDMLTTNFGTRLTHNFLVAIPSNGPYVGVKLVPSSGNEDLCDESPLVVSEITLQSSSPDFDCFDLSSMTGFGNSHET